MERNPNSATGRTSHNSWWQRLRLLMAAALLLGAQSAIAQCTCNNTTSFGSAVAPAPGNSQQISTCSWAGSEYSTITGVCSNRSYTFTHAAPGTWVTVREGTPAGPVLGCGPAPFTVTTTSTNNLYPHWNTNSACGTSTGTCYATGITALAAPPGPPSCAASYTPVNFASQVGLSQQLSWSPGNCSNPANTGYDVYFGSTFPPPLVSANYPLTTYNPGALACNTIYYWQVNPINAFGTASCPVQFFQTLSQAACPATFTPANFTFNTPLVQPISWTAVTGSTSYNVYFGNVSPPPLATSTVLTTWTPPTLACNTQYYWRIEPVNCSGPQTGCNENVFFTFGIPPGCATASVPANAATGVVQTTTITWNAGSNASAYNLYFGTNQVDVSNSVLSTQVLSNWTGTTYTPPAPLACNTVYYWKVEPINCVTTNSGCPTFSFTTVSVGPATCPTLNQPNAGATLVPWQPPFSWQPVPGATAYQVYLGVNPTQTLVATTANLFYTPPANLLGSTTYIWRINPVYCGGSVIGTCTTTRTFTTAASNTPAGNLNYNVSYDPAVYTPIVGNPMPGWQSATSTSANISTAVSLAGFNFNYNGAPVTAFKAGLGGFITFNTTITSTVTTNQLGALTAQPTFTNVLAPFWDALTTDGSPNTAASLAASVRYEISGAPGSQVLTVQWNDMDFSGQSQTRFNFQVKCYETSNNIEFKYGDMEGFQGVGNFGMTYSIGLNTTNQTLTSNGGPLAGQVLALQREREKAFSAYNCSNTSGVSANTLTDVPVCNTRYLFTPGAYSGDGPLLGAPANDNAGGAVALTRNPLPCTTYCGTYYSSRFATQSVQTACTGLPDDDVWFTFTVPGVLPPGSLGTRVVVGGYNNYDPVIEIMDNTFTSIACQNNTTAGLQEAINLGAIPAGTYYLRVYHSGAGSGVSLTPGTRLAGDFTVCVSEQIPPPANDDCLGAITLTSATTCAPITSPNMLTATASPVTSCNGTADDDVWYVFQPLTTAPNIQVQSGAGFNAVVQIFSSTGACGALTSVVCQNNTGVGGLESVTTFTTAVPGAFYYVRVYHQPAGTSANGFTICLVETTPPCPTLTAPANGAGLLSPVLTWTSGGGTTVSYDVLLDTNNPPTTPVATNLFATTYTPVGLVANTQYFWQVLPKNGVGPNTTCAIRNFTTCDPPAGTISFTENCVNGTMTLTVNLTSMGSAPSVDIVASPGGLFIGGDDYAGPLPASFQLTVPTGAAVNVSIINNATSTCAFIFPPQIDCCSGLCVGALTAVPGMNFCPAQNCGAGAASGGTTSNGGVLHARWFKFTAPNNGTLQVSSCGPLAGGFNTTECDTRLRIRSGACGSQVLVASGDDGCQAGGTCTTSYATPATPTTPLVVTAGSTYYIEWDNYWAGSTGTGAAFNWNLDYKPCQWGAATINVNESCGLGFFTYDLNVLTLGSSVQWKLLDNGVAIDTVNATGIYSFGPHAIGSTHNLTAVDLALPTCTVTVGSANDCCGSTCANALPAVLGLNQVGPMNCGAGASNAATLLDGPPFPPAATDARWFYYTPAQNGVLTVTSCNPANTTNSDTYLTVHQGSTCGSTVVTVFDNNSCNTPANGSAASFTVLGGTNYFIEWDDRYNGNAHGWDMSFIPCVSSPSNDLCASTNPLTNSLTPNGATAVLTGDVNCSDRDGAGALISASVAGWTWESFHLDTCARVVIDFCGSPAYTNNNIASIFLVNSCTPTALINPTTINFAPVGPGCTPGMEQATFDLAPGDYYLPVLWAPSFGIAGAYQVNIDPQPPVLGCSLCANAATVTCASATNGTTAGFANTLPATACSVVAGQPASTGGTVWYKYVNTGGDTLVNLSTCSPSASFNTRVSVYSSTGCSNFCCVTYNENGPNPPCTASGSQTRFIALAGQTYYIVVHGNGAGSGTFTLQVVCEPEPTPPSNDNCAGATSLTPVVLDGTGPICCVTPGDNTFAMPDPGNTCSPLTNLQGVWYTFNSGSSSSLKLTINESSPFTAQTLGYALYSGGCQPGICFPSGATQVGCNATASTAPVTLSVTPMTNYRMLVYNQGGIGVHGTFGVLLEYPANYDASVDSVIVPGATVCGTVFNPQVILKNLGTVQLNTATITYQIDAQPPVNYLWFGALNTNQTEVVSITPAVSLPAGIHTFTATVSNPNGQVDEIPSNDAVPSFSFDNTGQPVRILMRTDAYGEETGYEIFNADDFFFAASGGEHPNTGFAVTGTPAPWADNSTIIDDLCLPQNTNGEYCYLMVVYDDFGDGMCCGSGNGFWSVQTQQGDVLLRDKFDVNSTFTPTGGPYIGHTFCLPKGPTDILPSECNIFTNSLYSKVYCANVGASTYQFSFENPDAGFYRRISVPTNWVQFSQIQSAPTLVPGTVYFCRVRADQGTIGYADDRFGAGCDMAIDPAAINGCTQLIDNISLPTHSCGVTKTFGGSDKIWAYPIVGATSYRFRFQGGLIDPDGPSGPQPPAAGSRIITRTSYVNPLNWFTFTLVDGQTYNVTIEVFLAGSWQGYCGPSCTVTIDNTPMQGNNNLHVTAQDPNSTVTMWPNPVRDGLVNLVLSELGENEVPVTVDVYDGFGKLVRNYEFTSSSDLFTTVLDLGDLAAGNYTVTIVAGDKSYTERLNVQ